MARSCPQCGSDAAEGEAFCPSCGYFLAWDTEEDADEAAEPETARRPGAAEPEESEAPPEEGGEASDGDPETIPLGHLVTCLRCREPNPPDRTFCRRCGAELEVGLSFREPDPKPTTPETAPAPEAPPSRSRRWIPVVAAVVGLAVAGGLLAALALSGEDSDPATTPQAGDTTPTTSTGEVTTQPPETSTTAADAEPEVLDTPDVSALRFERPPTIDGDPDDWAPITTRYLSAHAWYRPENWTGPEDLSAEWRLAWDEGFLYVLVEVTDDVHSQERTERLWEGDSVDVQIDTELAADADEPLVDGDDYEVILSPGDFGSNPPTYVAFVGRGDPVFTNPPIDLPVATVAATPRQPAGYVLEARIPWGAVGVVPEPGLRAGFALSANDNDTPGEPAQETMMANHPDVRVAEPQTWGTLTLESRTVTPGG